MTKTENSSIITTTDFSRAPHRISKRKIKIGERITREILANPKERSEILEGLAQIKRGECVVWKKKGLLVTRSTVPNRPITITKKQAANSSGSSIKKSRLGLFGPH